MVALTEQQKREARPWADEVLWRHKINPDGVSWSDVQEALGIVGYAEASDIDTNGGVERRGPDIYVNKGASHKQKQLGSSAVVASQVK